MFNKIFNYFKNRKNITHTITDDGNMSVVFYGKTYVINPEHVNYKQIKEKLERAEYSNLLALMDIPRFINTVFDGKVTISQGKVYFNGKVCDNFLAKRIEQHLNEGKPFKYLLNFMENVMLNPLESARNELFMFLEHGNMPITSDGHFLAYKRVKSDMKDYYTGKYDHSVGAKPEMPFSEVDPDRNQTCSRGFHFCALSYLPSYHNNQGVVVILKIHPKDVGAIPSDYENAKGRASTYEVICVYGKEKSDDKILPMSEIIYDGNGKVLDVAEFNRVAQEEAKIVENSFKHDYDIDEEDWEEEEDYDDYVDEDCEEDVPYVDDNRKGVAMPEKIEKPTGGMVSAYGVKPSGQRYYQVRGPDGKFLKKN